MHTPQTAHAQVAGAAAAAGESAGVPVCVPAGAASRTARTAPRLSARVVKQLVPATQCMQGEQCRATAREIALWAFHGLLWGAVTRVSSTCVC
eukprot:364784-Chlamydomonas_euryale.AAC.4